jgi:hypothetical protein
MTIGDGTASYRRRAKQNQREASRKGGLRTQTQRRCSHCNHPRYTHSPFHDGHCIAESCTCTNWTPGKIGKGK